MQSGKSGKSGKRGESFLEWSHRLRAYIVQWFAGIQWLGFMFANTVVIPLSVGSAFHLSAPEISGAMSRSFIMTGVACLIQVCFGHRLPLMEGQSGLWWGVILGLASLGATTGTPIAVVGGSVAAGVMLGGLTTLLCGLLGLHRLLNRLFTPIVMAVLLVLLAAQLMDIFFRGMVGLQVGAHIHVGIALLSVCIVAIVSFLTIGAEGLLSNFAILIGLVFGWLAFVMLFGSHGSLAGPSWNEVGHMFAWGTVHHVQLGIIIACMITALLNTTNTIATLRAAEPLFNKKTTDGQFQRSLVWSGVFTMVSGPLSLVPYIQYTSSIGFLRSTRLMEKTPFVIGAILFTVLGAIPSLAGFFATLPISVGDSVLFVAYLQLFGSALQNLEGMNFNYRTVFRIAAPILVGLAIQSTPPTAFSSLPGFSQSIVSNGMLVGILFAILLEAFVPWQKWAD